MSHGHFLRAIKEWGVSGTFKKLYKMRTLKFGSLIGVDKYGNEYYENTIDYPHGQHRWVEYAGDKNFYQIDASNVPAEWHLWLHGTTAEPPTDRKTGSSWRNEPLANAVGSSAPYARNVGGVITAHTPNLSQYRPRGFDQANNIFPDSQPNEELFYSQPGYPMDKRNKQLKQPRKLSFTLRDTPLTLRDKAAARAGMTPEEYDMASDPSLPARVALLAAKDALPASSPFAGLAEKLSKGDGEGHNLDYSAERRMGTFAAAKHEALSAEEEEFLEQGYEEAQLMETVAQYQRYIDDYSKIRHADANVKDGLERAAAVRDDARSKLEKLRAIESKLEKLAAKFDEKVYQ